MTTAELHFQLRFASQCITWAIDQADAAFGRGDWPEGEAWQQRCIEACNRHAFIHAMWRESQANGLGRV